MPESITCPSCQSSVTAGDPPRGDAEEITVDCPVCATSHVLGAWRREHARAQRAAQRAEERQRREDESAAARAARNRRRAEEADAREAELRRLANAATRQEAVRREQEKLRPAKGPALFRRWSAWAPVLFLFIGNSLAVLGAVGIVVSAARALVEWKAAPLFDIPMGLIAVMAGVSYTFAGSVGTAAIRTASATEDMLAIMIQERQERLEAEARAAAGHRPPLADARSD